MFALTLIAPAAATPSATTIAATATTTAASAATFGLGPGFVDRQRATVHFFPVKSSDGGLGFLVAAHLDKTESLGPTRVPVLDHLRRLHGAVGREHLFQIT